MTARERIIEQAMRMFLLQGLKSVRMDDIAQQLGVSKRTLYDLFGDKEGLLYEAMKCYFEGIRLRHKRMGERASNVLEGLFMALSDVMDGAAETSRMQENLKRCHPALFERLQREAAETHRADFRQMLEQGIEEGFFTDRFNVELAISVLYYTASALVLRKGVILPEGLSEREAFVQVVSNFFRGISTARGMELIDDYLTRYDPARR